MGAGEILQVSSVPLTTGYSYIIELLVIGRFSRNRWVAQAGIRPVWLNFTQLIEEE